MVQRVAGVAALMLLGCGPVSRAPTVGTSRVAAVRIYDDAHPPQWRYRVGEHLAGESCGSVVVPPSENDARADLRARAAESGAHGVVAVLCRGPFFRLDCSHVLRCEGEAIRWLPNQ